MKFINSQISRLIISVFAICLLSFKSYAAEDGKAFLPVFDAEYYYNENPDLQELVGMDPEALLAHYANLGIWEGRSGTAEFNLKAYVRYNPDLLNIYKTDWAAYCQHYERQGKSEGRICLLQPDEKVIGFYHTDYDKTRPRAENIALAASRIDGTVLQPGEAFSFSEAILSRIPENGYVLAPAIGGMEYGGGICQVSSTLYAAMCNGMVPASERHPHSSPVSYMPVGLDATISEGYKDLKFTNPYDDPITIQAVLDETGITVSLLWDTPEEVVEQPSEEETDSEVAAEWIPTGPGWEAPEPEMPEPETDADSEGEQLTGEESSDIDEEMDQSVDAD